MTEAIASETKRQKRNRLRRLLVQRFPRCFVPRGTAKKPLAIGIMADLIARCPDLTEDDIRFALLDYTRGYHHYRSQFLCGAPRIDLDGNQRGEVSPSDAVHAGRLLMDGGLVEQALAIARTMPRLAA